MEKVILVDENDQEIGVMEKMEAHEKGLLHRAFSIFIFNSKGELLLQKRSANKYHSGGLWTNTCCSHPKPEEDCLKAAQRRLKEEMGIMTDLHLSFHFTYKAILDNNLTEHEFDHVFIGKTDDEPIININEAEDFKYMTPESITAEIKSNPNAFTAWFRIIFNEFPNHLKAD